jgi:hypothetical protein
MVGVLCSFGSQALGILRGKLVIVRLYHCYNLGAYSSCYSILLGSVFYGKVWSCILFHVLLDDLVVQPLVKSAPAGAVQHVVEGTVTVRSQNIRPLKWAAQSGPPGIHKERD